MSKKLLRVLVICALLYTLLKSESCSTPASVCIQIDPESCPGADISNAVLHLKQVGYDVTYYNLQTAEYSEVPLSGFQRQEINHSSKYIFGTASGELAGFQNYIEGYEINYGFWSKDSFRRYTWAEMFEWKNGRTPTPQELASLTCEQVGKWFKERHTVKRSLLPDDPPHDVICTVAPIKKYCFDINYEEYILSGKIEFPDGSKCELEEVNLLREDFSGSDNPNQQLMKIKQPCAACNMQ